MIGNNAALLSIAIWLPLIGAILMLVLPGLSKTVIKAFSVGISAGTLGLAVYLATQFKPGTFHFQFGTRIDWIKQLGIRYELGIDGISIWMIVLTAILGLVATLISTENVERPKAYFGLLLALQTTMLGVFSALDLVLFYTFFELSLVPVTLLILNWGGTNRQKVSIKYLAALFAGSILMLVGIIALAKMHQNVTGVMSFSVLDIQRLVANGELWKGALVAQGWIFWAFALAFLVKSPAVPFHNWLGDTYVESPISAIVAAVVLKVGTYGMFRFLLPLFPEALPGAVVWLMLLGVVGIIYGGVLAAGQTNGHRLLGFSTISHVGFILIGLFSLSHTGLSGAAFQQLNHGLTAAALFVLLGFLYKRKANQSLEEFGGLKRQMPYFAFFFLVAMLANVGLPGTSGFVGEFLAMLGAFEASYSHTFGLNPAYAVVAGFGVVLSAVYLLYMFQKLFYGAPKDPAAKPFADLTLGEFAIAGVFTVLMIGLGIFPAPIQKSMETSVTAVQMMAINPVGQRPVWQDLTHEIVSRPSTSYTGNLVELPNRAENEVGNEVTNGKLISLFLKHPVAETGARSTKTVEPEPSEQGGAQ